MIRRIPQGDFVSWLVVFPNRASVVRLVGTLLIDTDENWRGERQYMAQEGMSKLLNPEREEFSELRFDPVDELFELEAQNTIVAA